MNAMMRLASAVAAGAMTVCGASGAETLIGLARPVDAQGKTSSRVLATWSGLLATTPGHILCAMPFQPAVIEDADLARSEQLNRYAMVIIPNGRAHLTPAMMSALKTYVAGGGLLMRESFAVARIDSDGDGKLSKAEMQPSELEAMKAWWKELAGALPENRPVINYIDRIRFTTNWPALTRGLPADWRPLDLPCRFDALQCRPYFETIFYNSTGADIVAEAELLNQPTPDLKTELNPLGAFPVVTCNKYGKGECVCIGLNLMFVLERSYKYPSDMYIGVYRNLMKWAVERYQNSKK